MNDLELLNKKEVLDKIKQECKILKISESYSLYKCKVDSIYITVRLHGKIISDTKIKNWSKHGLQYLHIKRRRRIILKFLIK